MGKRHRPSRGGYRVRAGAFGLVLAVCSVASAQEQPAVIGSGGVTGLYYPIAGAVASTADGLAVYVESTGGSLENLVRLRQGDLDMAIARSDLVYDAAFGLGPFAIESPYGELRVVATLHAEPLLIIARTDSAIRRVSDIDGHRVQLGQPETATARLFELVLGAQEWPDGRYRVADPVDLSAQTDGLCAGDYDVMAFISGAPSGTVHDALTRCDARLVAIDGPGVEGVLREHPALVPVTVPAGTFPSSDAPLETLGPVALLVTTVDQPEERVAALVQAMAGGLEEMRTRHPSLAGLTVRWMATAGQVVALHDGAAAAFESLRSE